MSLQLFIAAAVFTWVPAMSAHAGTDITTTRPAFMGTTGRAEERVELPDEALSSAKTGEIASLGGAIYNPFADVPRAHRSQGVALKRSPKVSDAGMGLTIFVTLAGIAMVGCLLRRAWDN